MSSFKQVPTTKFKQGGFFCKPHTLRLVLSTLNLCTHKALEHSLLSHNKISISGSLLINNYTAKQMLKFPARKLDMLLNNQLLLKTDLKIKLE